MIAPEPAPRGAHLPGLVWTLVRTDFKTRYHGTIGGYFLDARQTSNHVHRPDVRLLLRFFDGDALQPQPHYWPVSVGFFAESTRTGGGCLADKAFLGQEKSHRLRDHRGAAIGVKREIIVFDPLAAAWRARPPRRAPLSSPRRSG
jgi:hypothetical protein